jgi:LPS O-antigen subunit length determinant protein (WzzB/FepE family)
MQMQESTHQQSEIDLKGFFRIIAASKEIVIGITLVATIIAGIYAYTRTPIYEATVLVQIGSYKLKDSQVIDIENTPNLVKKLYTKHIVIENNNKNDVQPQITSIIAPKKTNGFIEIKAEAVSNELAVREVNRVVNSVKDDHNNIIDGYRRKFTLELENLKNKIESISDIERNLLKEQINKYKIILLKLAEDEGFIQQNIEKIEDTNPVLALVKHGGKKALSVDAFNTRTLLTRLQTNEVDLRTTKLYEKLEEKITVELLLESYNLRNTQIVGKIITNDYPIRPMRKLIIILSFIASLIFSIFIIFTRHILKED